MSKWEMVRLGDVCKDTENNNPNLYDKDIIYIDISSICNEKKKITDYNTISSKTAPSRARQKVQYGDILVSTVRPNLNAVAIIDIQDDSIIASTGFCVLRPDNNRINSKYFFEFVKSFNFVRSMSMQATGASYPAVSNSIVKSELIPLPPLQTQQKIAEILDRANTLIEKRKAQMEKLDLLIKSQFIEMFGDPVTNPKGWEVKKLSECLRIIGGYAFSSENYKEIGIPVIRIGNINMGTFNSINIVFWDYDEKLDRYLLRPGDLVISLTGTVGKDDYANVCILGCEYERYYLNQRNAKLELLESIDKQFLTCILRVPEIKKKLTGISRGVRQANISNSDILNLELPIPSIKVQTQFADFVNQVETQKSQLKKGLELLELNYKSLMQKCMSGEMF